MRSRTRVAFALGLALASGLSCSDSLMDDIEDEVADIPIDEDMRVYARQARARLSDLTPRQRAAVEPALVAHERALAHYDRMLTKGDTRRAAMAPLMVTGLYVVGNDVTAIGVADDAVLPFLALGALGVALFTAAPASPQEFRDAHQAVTETAKDVAKALKSVQFDGAGSVPSTAASQTEEEARARQRCIETYVDCQQNAIRSFNRRGCQTCMDRCIVHGYEWPEGKECDYLGKRRWRRLRSKPVPIKI